MSYTEELMKSWEDKPEEKPVETPAPEDKPEEKPQEQPQETHPAEENQQGGTKDTPEDKKGPDGPETQNTGTPPEDKPEDKPADPPKEKPDLSNLSQEEKAQHAFRRQLNKQASKYESIIAEMNSKFDTVTKELADLKKNKAEEPVKTREQFDSDDEYVDYLASRRVDAKWAEKEAKAAEEKAEKDKKAKEEQEALEQQQQMAANFNQNCRAAFKDEAYDGFQANLKRAVDNGLAELLDQAPAVRDFVFQAPEGPLVLNEMLSDKNAFMRIMSRGGNPMSAIIEMHDLAKEIQTRAQAPAEEKPKSTMPNIGKPGAKQAGHAATMWESDEALLDYVRKHK